jgi:sec-independent protein translocase protein TatA
LNDLTGNVNSEIDKVKTNLLGETSNTFSGITDTFTSEVNKTKDSLLSGTTTPDAASLLDDLTGPIKRQM